MLYLVGGAPRVGKSQLVNELINIKPMPNFSLDYLYSLEQVNTIPGFSGAAILEKGRAFYPTLKQLLLEVNLRSENCVIEGEVILPEFIRELSASYEVRCCFIGISSANMETILEHGGHFNWPKWKLENGLADEVKDLAERTVARSLVVQEEARKYKQRYFDLTDNYELMRQSAVDYLIRQN